MRIYITWFKNNVNTKQNTFYANPLALFFRKYQFTKLIF